MDKGDRAAKGDGGPLVLAKINRRQDAVAVRDNLPPSERAAASDAITRALAALLTARRDALGAPLRVATYCPVRSEVDVASLPALSPSDTVFLYPRVVPGTPLLELAGGPLAGRGPYGISEPTGPAVALEHIDVVIVPGLAFGPAGERLGYGKGYYDRVLPRLSRGALRVGVAFEAQLGPLPTGPLDHPVDKVITEKGERFNRL